MGSPERGRRYEECKEASTNADLNRRAAALAWYKHGRKASSMKLHNPSSSSPSSFPSSSSSSPLPVNGGTQRRAPQQHSGSGLRREGSESLPCNATRFRSEALALQPARAIKQHNSIESMTTDQSLALLSLLPHHQSQKRFYRAEDPSSPTASNTPWDCGSSLYDSFELLCLSNQLGRCLTTVKPDTTAGSSRQQSPSRRPSLQGPSLPPTYIPRSLYALPQFILPSYIATKSSKKRSSLIHPIFCNMPTSISIPTSPSALPAPAPPHPPPASSQHRHKDSNQEKEPSKSKASKGGLRRVFNSLLKTLHMKEGSQQAPKRSNLSEELEKLPKHRPTRAPLSSSHVKDRPPMKVSPTCSGPAANAAPHIYQHNFRNEGFRTTSITRPPKFERWDQHASF